MSRKYKAYMKFQISKDGIEKRPKKWMKKPFMLKNVVLQQQQKNICKIKERRELRNWEKCLHANISHSMNVFDWVAGPHDNNLSDYNKFFFHRMYGKEAKRHHIIYHHIHASIEHLTEIIIIIIWLWHSCASFYSHSYSLFT